MLELFAGPAEWPPAFYNHHNLLLLIYKNMRDGLEALPTEANVEDIVTVCRPIR